jgi:hypothetical protein
MKLWKREKAGKTSKNCAVKVIECGALQVLENKGLRKYF